VIILASSYSQLMTPDQIRKYASGQANQQYLDAKQGYQNQINLYNQQMKQLHNDAWIQNYAKNQANNKYADAFTSLSTQWNDAQANDKTQRVSYLSDKNNAEATTHNTAFVNRQQASEDMIKRGLYNSSILDGTKAIIGQGETSAIGQIQNTYNQQIDALDTAINTLKKNLDSQRTSLTKQQGIDIATTIDKLTEERNNKKDELNTLIKQQYDGISMARKNADKYADSLYQDMFSKQQAIYEQRQQQAAELAQRQREMAQQKQLAEEQLAEQRAQRQYEQAIAKQKLDAATLEKNEVSKNDLVYYKGAITKTTGKEIQDLSDSDIRQFVAQMKRDDKLTSTQEKIYTKYLLTQRNEMKNYMNGSYYKYQQALYGKNLDNSVQKKPTPKSISPNKPRDNVSKNAADLFWNSMKDAGLM
jgi:hypothetical protein